jgi:DHA2 family multidrug resistance protein-like MFS transporter
LIGVPAMLVLLLTGPLLLPEFREPAAGRLDFPSAGLSLTAVLSLVFGLKWLAEHGLSWLPVAFVSAGAALGAAFVARQAKLATPLLDLQLFRRLAFAASLSAYALGGFVCFGVFVLIGQYLQLVLGLSAQAAGLWTTPFAVAFIVGGLVTPPLSRRVPPRLLLPAGLLLAAGGFALLTRLDPDAGVARLVTGLVVFSLGLAPVFTLSTDLVVGSAPAGRAGAAAAISETGVELGGALGIAILGSIAGFAYRAGIAKQASSALSTAAVATAQGTLGAALKLAGQLQGASGPQLADVARRAFTASLELTAGIAAVLSLLMAGATALALREPCAVSATAASTRERA